MGLSSSQLMRSTCGATASAARQMQLRQMLLQIPLGTVCAPKHGAPPLREHKLMVKQKFWEHFYFHIEFTVVLGPEGSLTSTSGDKGFGCDIQEMNAFGMTSTPCAMPNPFGMTSTPCVMPKSLSCPHVLSTDEMNPSCGLSVAQPLFTLQHHSWHTNAIGDVR